MLVWDEEASVPLEMFDKLLKESTMAGKYANVLKTLERAPDQDQKRADAVRAHARELKVGALAEIPSVKNLVVSLKPGPSGELSLPDLATEYRRLRQHKELLESALSVLSLSLEAISLMVEQGYEAAGLTSLKLLDGGSVSSQPEPIGVVEDKEKFLRWCAENGLSGSLTLPWQTMCAVVRERLLDNLPLPDGVKAYSRPKLVLR